MRTNMRTRTFTALVEPADEGGYVVKCVEVPVATQGETKREALRNLKDAVEGYLEIRAEILGRSLSRKEIVEIAVRQAPSPILA